MTQQQRKMYKLVRMSGTMQLYPGAIVAANQDIDKGYVWLDFKQFYGSYVLTIFLPDGTPFETAEQIAALFNQSLTEPETVEEVAQ